MVVIYQNSGEIKMRNLITEEHYNVIINTKTLIKDIVVDGQPLIEHIDQYVS
jgi:hypothetical protein